MAGIREVATVVGAGLTFAHTRPPHTVLEPKRYLCFRMQGILLAARRSSRNRRIVVGRAFPKSTIVGGEPHKHKMADFLY
jgi:hypothetical protein